MKSIFKRYKPYYWSNLALAAPVVVSQLGHTMVQTADSIIVGQFAGTIPLAAVSLVHSVFMVVLVLGLGIAYGITPLVAQENGKENYTACAKLLSNSLTINVFSGIALFLLVYFGSMTVIDHLNQAPEVVKEAKPYLLILSLSILPLMVFSTFKQFAEGLGFTKQAMYITIWGNVLNIVLAIIFVKGLFGIPPMGIKGVGYATLIDRILMAIVMCAYLFKSTKIKPYLSRFSLYTFDKKLSAKLLKIGLPVAMQYAFEVGAFATAAIIAGTLGAYAQAAHQVSIQLASTTYMMASGIAAAATIKTGTNFGRQNKHRLQMHAASSYHIILLFMCCTALLFISLNGFLPYLFTRDQEVIVIASKLLLIAGIFQLFDGTQVVGLGILRGMGDVNVPTVIAFFSYWVVGIPVAYLMGTYTSLGVMGIWLGLTLGLMCSSVLLFLRYKKRSRALWQ